MALEYWNTDKKQASGRNNMVLVPTSMPVVSRLSIDSLMAHLDDYVYDKTESSHIRHLIEALCGECGMGELLNESVKAWLNSGVDTAWLTFVDRLLEQIYGLPRIWSETVKYDPAAAIVTTDEMSEILIKEAWYKARFVDLMRAFNCGGTVKGFKYAVHAMTYDDCDIYETWRYKHKNDGVGRLGYTMYNEVVIAPYNTDYTPKQGELLLRILDRIKPADTVVTLEPKGLAQYKEYKARNIAASSTYFEVVKHIRNSVDTNKLPSTEEIYGDVMPYGYSELPSLDVGKQVEARNAVNNHVQENFEYYVHDKSSMAGIESVEYYSSINGLEDMPEENWQEQVHDVRWSTWRHFDLADSPDNYPGGKYGITPKHAPALAKDGSAYIFDYNSQHEYEQEKSRQIIDAGGQVNGHDYRTILSRSAKSNIYLPEMALVSVNDAINSIQSLPTQSWQPRNIAQDEFSRSTH